VAEASGAEDLANIAREIYWASDADLASEIRELLARAEVMNASPDSLDLEVLVVEDDRVLATMLHGILKKQARRVHVAASADDAERLVQQHPIDLILLDLILPDRDGRDFLVQLRQSSATAEIPVIVLSGQEGAAARAECLAVGASDFLVKPPDPVALRATVARMSAPRRRSALAAKARSAESAPSVSVPTKVLLVEDDRVTATLIRHRLVRDGMEVTDFANGEDAFRWAEGSGFDIAILDVKVPGMDGFELLGRLRMIPRLAHVPVVMLTALTGEADVVRGLGLGASDYMVKPFSPAELLARVRRLVPASVPAAAPHRDVRVEVR
jgi:two-component system cell cycle response regulator